MSENRVTVLNLCYIWVPPDWTQDWAVLLDTFWRVLVPLSLCQSRLSLTGLLLSSLCSLNSSTLLSKLENAGLYPPWISHNLLIQYTMLGSLLAIALSPCLLFQSLPVQAWLQNSITVISVTGLDKHSFIELLHLALITVIDVSSAVTDVFLNDVLCFSSVVF